MDGGTGLPVRLPGTQILVEYLVRRSVPISLPASPAVATGRSSMLIDRPDAMRMVHAMHENPAAHLAAGHDRVAGRPMKATTGIGPGRKGGQQAFLGRTPATDPARLGEVYRPTNQAIGRGFGLASQAVDDPAAVHPGLERALVSGGPSIVASRVSRDLAERGLDTTGRWDAPFPEHHPEQLAAQLGDRAEEQHR